mmetsp:Transcript_41216/g.87796  ORF Transcript_41216/g.87796 Transcript_41216/m.87796 type:complete len:242 (+) Transcript_41216:489-1214(+)
MRPSRKEFHQLPPCCLVGSANRRTRSRRGRQHDSVDAACVADGVQPAQVVEDRLRVMLMAEVVGTRHEENKVRRLLLDLVEDPPQALSEHATNILHLCCIQVGHHLRSSVATVATDGDLASGTASCCRECLCEGPAVGLVLAALGAEAGREAVPITEQSPGRAAPCVTGPECDWHRADRRHRCRWRQRRRRLCRRGCLCCGRHRQHLRCGRQMRPGGGNQLRSHSRCHLRSNGRASGQDCS